MKVEALRINLRPRSPWEAVDLGFALARHWFLPLWSLWLLSAFPLGLLLWLWQEPGPWLFSIWWGKPLYEAPLLYWLSRKIFGESLNLKALWREKKRIFPLALLPNLLWRRLVLQRPLQFALIQLEGLRGKARQQRQQVLGGSGGTLGWLTILCAHLEFILFLSALFVLYSLIPEELEFRFQGFWADQGDWLTPWFYWSAMSLIAPFYVSAGFTLYLHRRGELEAWDLDLRFRQAQRKSLRGRAAIYLGLSLMLSNLFPQPAQASALTPEQAKREIRAVLAQEAFHRVREIQTWVYRPAQVRKEESWDLSWLQQLRQRFEPWGKGLALFFKWVLILGAAWFLARLISHRLSWEASYQKKEAWNQSTSRVHCRKRPALPAEVPQAVRNYLTEGNLRAALGLLYAASLQAAQERYGLSLSPGTTEGEYLAALAQKNLSPEVQALMKRLVVSWQQLAYGHYPPEAVEIDPLFQDWQRWWAEQA